MHQVNQSQLEFKLHHGSALIEHHWWALKNKQKTNEKVPEKMLKVPKNDEKVTETWACNVRVVHRWRHIFLEDLYKKNLSL